MERGCILPVPDDLVQDILSRLRVKDLLRLRCVSKEWRTFIDNSNFIMKHYQVQHSICKGNGNMPHFVHESGLGMIEPDDVDKFYLLFIQKGEDVITLNLTDDLERDSKDMLINGRIPFSIVCVGCVNGIICLAWEHRSMEFLGLWNPATREFKAIVGPDMPGLIHRSPFLMHGFGFDPLSNDFKILGSYCIYDGFCCYYELYSLKTNSWKRLTEPPAIVGLPTPRTDAYLDGVYYWTTDLEQKSGNRSVIVSFNFSTEVFKVCDPPQDAVALASKMYQFQKMILYKEHLALVSCHEVHQEEAWSSIDIWVVTRFDDCGVPLLWQHLFSVKPTHADIGLQATQMDGDLLCIFMCPSEENTNSSATDVENECYLYNPSTDKLKKLGIRLFSTCYRYVESLFSFSKRQVL